MNADEIKWIVDVIEQTLLDEYTLDDYEKLTGYSKYHLTRMFKLQTGYTLMEYVSVRRAALGAYHLLYSDIAIINLAMMLNYQSQEAFTRSFKRIYHLPPGKYRKLMHELNNHKGVKNMVNEVKGWLLTGTAPDSYRMKKDTIHFHSGRHSATLNYAGDESTVNDNTFGTMMQSISAVNYKNKRIKFSAFIKTEHVDKCGLWARVDNKSEDILQFDNMMDRAIIGTNNWNYYAVVLDIPEEADSIHFGVLLAGKGQVWIDTFKVEEVEHNIPSTNTWDKLKTLPKEPINLDFEEL